MQTKTLPPIIPPDYTGKDFNEWARYIKREVEYCNQRMEMELIMKCEFTKSLDRQFTNIEFDEFFNQ